MNKIVRLDPLIHAPNRLQICALLNQMERMEFQALRDIVDVSDSVLSKHIKQLDDAGYVRLIKKAEGGRQRTWVALTSSGRKAFKTHVKELKKIVDLGN
ncbi:MAG: transcriptional regulator [Proteobacteria bacterium]|nr:transcriptional regulator [Pseudomonadota bacterium]